MAAHRSSPNQPLDRGSQAAIVASLVAADPEMHNLAREYVRAGLVEMLNQLQRGDASTRAAIARSMSGVVANLFTTQTGDDGITELRTEMQEMMQEMRGEIQARDDDVVASDVDELVERHRTMVPKS